MLPLRPLCGLRQRLENKETGEIKESEIFMGGFPIMTDAGTFVINGAERVIVSQLVRSPGVYYANTFDRTGKKLFTTTSSPTGVPGWNTKPTPTIISMCGSIKTGRSPSPPSCGLCWSCGMTWIRITVSADFNMGLVSRRSGQRSGNLRDLR